jgi:DNA-binding response OmpR family regulator
MKKVWIIDDDEEMVGAIQLMLQLLECESERFFSARPAAQALMKGQAPDLVILDLNMPEVNGIDFLEYVRRNFEWRDLPIIILSTEAADVMIDKAIDLGADGYITKPVAINELEAAMKKAFHAHENR